MDPVSATILAVGMVVVSGVAVGGWLTDRLTDRSRSVETVEPPDPGMTVCPEKKYCALCDKHTPHWTIETSSHYTKLTCIVCRGKPTEKHVHIHGQPSK